MRDVKTEFDIRQKVIASTTVEGWKNAPHVSFIYQADATELMKIFQKINKNRNIKITLNALIYRIIIEGIKAAPQVNSHVSFNSWLVRGTTKQFSKIHINMPMLLENGKMITVKLSDCGEMSLSQLNDLITMLSDRLSKSDIDTALQRVGLRDTVKRIRKGRFIHSLGRIIGHKWRFYTPIRFSDGSDLSCDDLDQGTVTISNLGAAMRGISGVVGLIDLVPPQVFAVGIGSLQDAPGVFRNINGSLQIGVRQMLPLCIVFDHRALDFGDVAPFIHRIDEVFAKPEVIT